MQVFASLWFLYILSFWLGSSGTISGRFSNKRSWVILRGDYPTSALRQSSRAFRKILSVDQGNIHCFAGRLKDFLSRSWLYPV
jgi:hypothetical protein